MRDLLAALPPEPTSPRGPGRPPTIPAAVLWAGLLVCVLRGFTAQRNLWQLLCLTGLWHYPTFKVEVQAVYERLELASVGPLLRLFRQVSAYLRERFAECNDVPYATFAADILALDHCRLDAVARKLKLFRAVARGEACLLPGQIATLFDVRRQLFFRVEFWEDPHRNEKWEVTQWLRDLLPGTLLLFDLGFFAFAWFDAITDAGMYFVSRQRQKTSHKLIHVFYDGMAGPCRVRDSLVYLGAYRADRAAHPVRLVEIFFATRTFRYLTNVLDPALLPAAHLIELYRRRWDIEMAFKFLKSQLNLFLLSSGHLIVVQLQVFASLIIAQVIFGIRNEIAVQAHAEFREATLVQLVRWVPEIARRGQDPVAVIVERGRLTGIIRPFRGQEYDLPEIGLMEYQYPTERPPPRKPRYPGKRGKTSDTRRRPRRPRTRGWGKRARRPRCA